MKRRQFLTLAAAAVAMARRASAQAGIKVAVMTHAGGAHLTIYFQALAAIEDVQQVVLADSDGHSEADARRILGGKLTGVYTDRNDMLTKEKPVLAVVSMEALLAPPAIDAALDAGCHVLAEKPACVNAADFTKLAQKADAKQRHLMLALANRVNPEVQEAKRAIAEGKLGAIYAVEMHLVQDQTRLTSPGYHTSWYADKTRAGGGHLAWLGIHWLDLAMFITGSPIAEVTGFTGNVGGQPISIEDAAAITMRFENGALGTLTSGYYLDKGSQTHLKVWGSKGRLEINSEPQPAMHLYTTADGESTFNRPDGFDPYEPFFRAAVSAAMGKGEPPVNSADSLRVLKTVYRAYDAAATGTATRVE